MTVGLGQFTTEQGADGADRTDEGEEQSSKKVRPGERTRKVLFLLNSLAIGGAEKQTVSLVNGLVSDALDLSLAYLKRQENLLGELDTSRLSDVFCCDVRRKLDWQSVRKLASHLKHKRTEVIVCVNQYPMIYAYLAQRRAGTNCKLVEVLHHNSPLSGIYDLIQKPLYRALFRRFHQTVFVANAQRQYWLRNKNLSVRRPIVIHNGIDLRYFTADMNKRESDQYRSDVGFSSDDYVAGICALLRPKKRHTDLLDAVASVRDRNVPLKLLIIGDGPERESIEERIRQLGLMNAVRITGYQTDVRPFIEMCDCMVIPSSSEAFSMAILEAMAMGKPVVSSAVGGAAEQIEDERTGFLFEQGDSTALAGHLMALVDPVLRTSMGRAARRKMEKEFTAERMIAAYRNALRRLT